VQGGRQEGGRCAADCRQGFRGLQRSLEGYPILTKLHPAIHWTRIGKRNTKRFSAAKIRAGFTMCFGNQTIWSGSALTRGRQTFLYHLYLLLPASIAGRGAT